ncbi:MAG: hypothetical protein BAA03_00845 [Caldibacillus debilis]|nr:MAG: hypothetical protein BAA03_00845 [Caldibacillus debilis]
MEIQRIKPTKWLAFFVLPAWCNPSDLGMTNRCRCEAGFMEANGGIMKLQNAAPGNFAGRTGREKP